MTSPALNTATCEQVEAFGGKAVTKAVGEAAGPDFACLLDLSGNLFGIFAAAGD
jgi:hypothetical protein